jgi:hypothetical protein
MSLSSIQDQQTDDPFWTWVATPFIRVASSRRHGQWYAVAEDFRIATSGATESEAYYDLARMVEAYLRSCYREGLDYWSAMRRQPRRVKLLNAIRSNLARALKGRAPGSIAEEGRFLLPNAPPTAPNLP